MTQKNTKRTDRAKAAFMLERQVRLRETDYDWEGMRWLTALIVGVGAVGGEVLKHLAHLGVGRVLVIDSGVVSRSNFSRSVLFSSVGPSAEGQKKAKIAQRVMKRWNPAAEVVPLAARVEQIGLGPFLEADLIFSCTDTMAARVYVAIQAMRAGVPLVEGGMLLHDIASLEVVATDPVSGPCGMLCRWDDMKLLAREDILPQAFFAHIGCTSNSSLPPQPSTMGAASLSMTASVVASQLVMLGLQLVRYRRIHQCQPYGTAINMSLRTSGDQSFRQMQLYRCSEVQSHEDCPLSNVRQMGNIAMDARLRPVARLSRRSRAVSLDDVLRRGARALNLPLSQVVVLVDEEFSANYYCETCQDAGRPGRYPPGVIHHIRNMHQCDVPKLVFEDQGRCSYRRTDRHVISAICGTNVEDMGFRAQPGWIVESTEDANTTGAVRVILETLALGD